jgi:hypothetical protein
MEIQIPDGFMKNGQTRHLSKKAHNNRIAYQQGTGDFPPVFGKKGRLCGQDESISGCKISEILLEIDACVAHKKHDK